MNSNCLFFKSLTAKIISVFLIVLIFGNVEARKPMKSKQKLTLTDFSEMQAQKKRIAGNETESLETYTSLIKNADKALLAGPFSVMNKTGIPPSGSKHDYMTLAPYFWPNPDTPNGLPYIRKDGEVNPETREIIRIITKRITSLMRLTCLEKPFIMLKKRSMVKRQLC